MMGLTDFWKTPTEKKRDEYDKLHDYLKDALKKHDEKMAEVKSDLSAYKKGCLICRAKVFLQIHL